MYLVKVRTHSNGLEERQSQPRGYRMLLLLPREQFLTLRALHNRLCVSMSHRYEQTQQPERKLRKDSQHKHSATWNHKRKEMESRNRKTLENPDTVSCVFEL